MVTQRPVQEIDRNTHKHWCHVSCLSSSIKIMHIVVTCRIHRSINCYMIINTLHYVWRHHPSRVTLCKQNQKSLTSWFQTKAHCEATRLSNICWPDRNLCSQSSGPLLMLLMPSAPYWPSWWKAVLHGRVDKRDACLSTLTLAAGNLILRQPEKGSGKY